MQSNNTYNTFWNLLRQWATIVAAIISTVSVVITYLFIPAAYRWALPPFVAVVLVVGVVVAAVKVMKQNQTQADKQIGNRDRKIAELEDEIKRLRTKPYDLALRKIAEEKLRLFNENQKKVLRYILMHGPIHASELSVPGVEEQERNAALEIGKRTNILRIVHRPPVNRPIFWDIIGEFKPVLKDLIFEHENIENMQYLVGTSASERKSQQAEKPADVQQPNQLPHPTDEWRTEQRRDNWYGERVKNWFSRWR